MLFLVHCFLARPPGTKLRSINNLAWCCIQHRLESLVPRGIASLHLKDTLQYNVAIPGAGGYSERRSRTSLKRILAGGALEAPGIQAITIVLEYPRRKVGTTPGQFQPLLALEMTDFYGTPELVLMIYHLKYKCNLHRLLSLPR